MDPVAVLGGVGTLATIVGGVLGAWWIKILDKRHQHQMDLAAVERKAKKEDAAADRKAKKDNMDDFDKLLLATQDELKVSRGMIHDLSNRVQTAETKEHVCQLRLTRAETVLGQLNERCGELMEYAEDLEDALRKANVPVIRRHRAPVPPPESAPPTGDNNG
jgi:chromosome segregation ATPase